MSVCKTCGGIVYIDIDCPECGRKADICNGTGESDGLKEAVKETTATITIDYNCDCPYCEEYIDIYAEDFELASDLMTCYQHSQKVNFNMQCPKCKKEFKINYVEM